MLSSRLFAVTLLVALPAIGWSYDSAFVLNFEEATDAEGFDDPNYANNGIAVAAENTPMDTVPYSVAPQNAPNYNGTKWLRIGAANQAAGVATLVYDGRAGGTATDAGDFTATVDVFIAPTYYHRYQVALFGRWLGSGTTPMEVFYSRNTPNKQDGFGWRYGGTETAYNAFTTTTATAPQWARLKMECQAATAVFSIDENCDGNYEFISPVQTVTNLTGKIGLQSIINNQESPYDRDPDQFAYFDNLTYTPHASVSEWSLF